MLVNSIRSILAGGIMYALKTYVLIAITDAEIIYGRSNLLKLTPDDRIAMISELSASFEVKKITAINVNKGLN